MTIPAGASTIAIDVDRVHVDIGNHRALDELSFTVRRGAVTALVGPNGAGKSTLVDVLAGVRRPSGGVLRRFGDERVALVPQRTETLERLPVTVRDVVEMGCWARRGPWRPLRREDRRAVAATMELLAIADLADRSVSSLSGGQRQRTFLAQAITQGAGVLLLDEPATGLDASSIHIVHAAIREEASTGVAVVVAAHDAATQGLADEVVTLPQASAVLPPIGVHPL